MAEPVYAKGTVDSPAKCGTAAEDPDNAVCARFDLTVDPPEGQWDDNPEGGVPVSIQWETPTDDFDMYIYDSAGKQVASSAGTADPESAVIPKASGTYRARLHGRAAEVADKPGSAGAGGRLRTVPGPRVRHATACGRPHRRSAPAASPPEVPRG
ncbi:PPC domain-containing protein [Streptomyces sp. NBC_00046]|uniref:PPC domain-containing protein n=1 Tax=unclassified Streptomyces TaxID=2593676 RepID=UPI00324321EF